VQPDSGIEISLCGHLLPEGMGTEAAAQAFDSQKLSLEDFHNSGATITKNEKLVVKIGERYFPWDATAPIILGMVSFGFEEPVNPEGAWIKNTSERVS
jgi:phosphatidate phosphatase LPIN